jgi:RNA polymerase sigma factor (sigma-70 family)
MAQFQLGTVVHSLRRLAGAAPADRTDEELLDAYLGRQDGEAFAALVCRHAALVMGVCRRTLGHRQDAEDAFQASFLVLARSAGSIRGRGSLASWLHGVASRVARNARRALARRRRHEQRGGARPEEAPADQELSWREAQALVDEEVGRLPEIYRAAFVLCCLEGRTKPEAARQLGVPSGTVASRLAKARRLLQSRLAARGVGLPALLVALDLGRDGARVGAATVRAAAAAAVASAAGVCGGVSAPVAALAAEQHRGAAAAGPAVLLTKPKLTAALVLLVALLGTGAGSLLPPGVAPPGRGESVAAAAPAAGKKEDSKTPEKLEVSGRVLDPDGKPAPGASLFFRAAGAAGAEAAPVRATADRDGRFRFAVTADPERATVVATAKGFGPAWEGFAAGREVVLKLTRDDVPLTGRLLSLEGAPLAGVRVEVVWVGQPRKGSAAEWIDHFVDSNRKGYWIHEGGLRILRPQALGLPREAVTGKDGRFRLTGFGRDRLVTVMLRGERTVATRLQVALRDGPRAGWVKGDIGLYPTGFTFLLPPTKPIVGTVRDRKTGKPIAGVLVSHGHHWAQATTDEKGEYRIIGAPKQAKHEIALGGKKGVPYIDYTRHDVPDTPGLEPLRVDFELERGVEISGRVLDKATGKPVRGEVHYFHSRDNPNVKDFTTLGGGKFIISKWGEIAPGGSFTALGIPGPGALVVVAKDSTRYRRVNASAELGRLKSNAFTSAPAHAVVAINASEKDPKSLSHTFRLTPAVSRPGRVTDPDGKPVVGARAAGLTDGTEPTALASDSLTMTGLGGSRDRAVVVIHEGRRLGALAAVRGDSDKPFEVKLHPLGALAGRLVGDEGQPLPGRRVIVFLRPDAKKFENLPTEYTNFAGIIGGGWRKLTLREVTTDKEGRFRLDRLLPGERYDLVAGEGKEPFEFWRSPSHFCQDFRVGPGEVKDAGDVKPRSR